jgi:hypothetical protein
LELSCGQCDTSFAAPLRRGRRPRFCSTRCESRFYYARRGPQADRSAAKMKCAACGQDMWRSRTSRPEGVATCRGCQRRAWGLAPDVAVTSAKAAGLIGRPKRPAATHCKRCDQPIANPSGCRRYCSDECFRKARNARGSGGIPQTSAAARGYGVEHQRIRAELLPSAHGQPCPLCGVVMLKGEQLHLDHTPDRSGYRGIVHGSCNVLDGAKRGGEAVRRKRLAEGWRHGQDPSTRRSSAHRAA